MPRLSRYAGRKRNDSGKRGEAVGGHELRFEISSCLSALDPLCEKIRRLMAEQGLEQMQFRVELVARECLNNAIIHGNGERADKSVIFGLCVGRKWVRLRVADQGAGFDWRKVGRRQQPDEKATSGRGLAMARAYSRRMMFNRQGNQITVWIRKAVK